jgi:hypothetical protein
MLGTDDIFAYFKDKGTAGQTPTLEDLETMAKYLSRQYSTQRAYERALDEYDADNPYSVPLGTPWKARPAEKSSQHVQSRKGASKKKQGKENTETEDNTSMSKTKGKKKKELMPPQADFLGDRSLGKSMAFMKDTMMSRKMSYAVAEGDIGGAYECVKVRYFDQWTA